MNNEFYLDLNRVTLWCWEERKYFPNIARMVEALESKVEFPPVPVLKIDNLNYSLVPYCDDLLETDGGHQRAVAHFIANVPLKCIASKRTPALECKIKLSDIFLTDDPYYR